MPLPPHRPLDGGTAPVAAPAARTDGPDWQAWAGYFLANLEAQRALDASVDWGAPSGLSAQRTARWLASVQRFQLGESGDGAYLLGRLARGGESELLAAARLFVAEEGSHAHLLGRLVERLGGVPLGSHWSDAAFVAARRCMGVPAELAVIAVAESVALVYYSRLAEAAPDPVIRAVAARILRDEQAHLPFVGARIAVDLARWGPARRGLLRAFWWAAGLGGTAVLVIDHAAALADCGAGRPTVARAAWSSVRDAQRATYRQGAAWRSAAAERNRGPRSRGPQDRQPA